MRRLQFAILFFLLSQLLACGGHEVVGFPSSRHHAAPVAPIVSSTIPANGAADVELDAVVTVTFSETMDPATLKTAFTLKHGTTAVSGVVNSAGVTSTFTPSHDFVATTAYTATISTGAKDAAGNALQRDYVWSFTTGKTEFTDDDDDDDNDDNDDNDDDNDDNDDNDDDNDDNDDDNDDNDDNDDDNDDNDDNDNDDNDSAVDLGSLTTFVAVAGAGLTNSNSGGVTTLNGNVGLYPTATCLGDGVPCTLTDPVINGTLYADDAGGVAAQAKVDLTAAYVDAMSRPVGTTVDDISGLVLAPGVYTSDSTMSIAVGGIVTLDGQDNENSVWIFQVGSSLTVNNNAIVLLINGAKAKNVFWAIFASSTLGSEVSFQGSVLAGASNSVGTDSAVVGRLLCTTGAITLLSNTITLPPN